MGEQQVEAATQQSTTLKGMPLGRRTPRGKRRWYIVYAPGREQATCNRIKKLIPRDLLEDAFVLRKERVRKLNGIWVTDTVPMYKDYLFVVTRDACALDRALQCLSNPVSICKGDGRFYTPISEEAQAWYEGMMDSTHTIRTSTAVIVDGELQIKNGPLMGQENKVTRVMRHQCSCKVAVADGVDAFDARVPFVVPFRS